MSTFADKYVDFEITVEGASGTSSALLPQKSGAPTEQHDMIEDLVFKVSGQLSTVNRMQKYFRTRENRNFSTVRSTEKRIFQFSAIEVLMMVGMAVLQVLVVRFFFQGARKGKIFSLFLLCGFRLDSPFCGCRVCVCSAQLCFSCFPLFGKHGLVFSSSRLESSKGQRSKPLLVSHTGEAHLMYKQSLTFPPKQATYETRHPRLSSRFRKSSFLQAMYHLDRTPPPGFTPDGGYTPSSSERQPVLQTQHRSVQGWRFSPRSKRSLPTLRGLPIAEIEKVDRPRHGSIDPSMYMFRTLRSMCPKPWNQFLN
jgi:hypothetical protein